MPGDGASGPRSTPSRGRRRPSSADPSRGAVAFTPVAPRQHRHHGGAVPDPRLLLRRPPAALDHGQAEPDSDHHRRMPPAGLWGWRAGTELAHLVDEWSRAFRLARTRRRPGRCGCWRTRWRPSRRRPVSRGRCGVPRASSTGSRRRSGSRRSAYSRSGRSGCRRCSGSRWSTRRPAGWARTPATSWRTRCWARCARPTPPRTTRTWRCCPARHGGWVVTGAEERAFLRALGGCVRVVRLDRGLSQEQFAETSGLSPQFVSQLERGSHTPNVVNLLRMAEALRAAGAAGGTAR